MESLKECLPLGIKTAILNIVESQYHQWISIHAFYQNEESPLISIKILYCYHHLIQSLSFWSYKTLTDKLKEQFTFQ